MLRQVIAWWVFVPRYSLRLPTVLGVRPYCWSVIHSGFGPPSPGIKPHAMVVERKTPNPQGSQRRRDMDQGRNRTYVDLSRLGLGQHEESTRLFPLSQRSSWQKLS